MITLEEGVQAYLKGINGPANAWGAYHVKAPNGDMVLSHAYLWWLYRKFGEQEVIAELNKEL